MVNCRNKSDSYKTVYKSRVNNLIPKLLKTYKISKTSNHFVIDHTNLGTTKKLISHGYKNITVINNNKNNCQIMKKANLGIKIINSDISNIVNFNKKTNVGLLYLDANGTALTYRKYICNVIKNKLIKDNVMLGVTFSKRTGKKKLKYSTSLKIFNAFLKKELEKNNMYVENIIDKNTANCKILQYGGGRGSKQSCIETIFYFIKSKI